MVRRDHDLSVRRQCGLLSLARSNLYYQPKGESAENLRFMTIIDRQFLQTPWYGSRQMARFMQREGHKCGRHRVRRLMKLMRLVPIYQTPNTSKKHPQHKVYPYLLRDLTIDCPNQVWWVDNRMIERLWRSLKYECIYLNAFEAGSQARAGVGKWLAYYNAERPHSTHGILTPDEAYERKVEPVRLAA